MTNEIFEKAFWLKKEPLPWYKTDLEEAPLWELLTERKIEKCRTTFESCTTGEQWWLYVVIQLLVWVQQEDECSPRLNQQPPDINEAQRESIPMHKIIRIRISQAQLRAHKENPQAPTIGKGLVMPESSTQGARRQAQSTYHALHTPAP